MVDDATLEEIKNRLDIVELISEYVSLKRSGQNHKGLCPFHSENTPSFMVNSAKQIYHCFGCNAGGDVFGFLMKHDGLTFPEVLELLAKRAGVTLQLTGGKPAQRGLKDTLKSATAEALRFFEHSLAASTGAANYLRERGLAPETIKDFRLGYAPNGWHALGEHLRKKSHQNDAVLKAGLSAMGQKGAYDIFRHRIIFPIFDMYGDPIAFGGRMIGDEQPKYLNSPDTPLFKKRSTLYAMGAARDAIRASGEAIVTEGYLDAIMCHQFGIKNTVAPLGTALTEEHIRLLKRFTERVVLLFDGDAAGVAAARRSLAILLSAGMDVGVLLLPENEDPDSLLRSKGAEYLMALIKDARSAVAFSLDSSGTGEVRTVKDAVSMIAQVNDPIRRDAMLRELSELTGTRELTLREELTGLSRRQGRGRAPAVPAPQNGKLAYNEEVLLLSAALSEPQKAVEVLGLLKAEKLRDPVVRGIMQRLATTEPGAALGVAESAEEKSLVSRLTIEPGFNPDELDDVVAGCIKKIVLTRITEKIEDAKKTGDHPLMSKLVVERNKLMQEA